MEYLDYFGNQIKVGDLLVWPNRWGGSMWMNHGYVLALGKRESWFKGSPDTPILQVKRVQTNHRNRPTGKYRNVEIEVLERTIALGRCADFVPRKQKAIQKKKPVHLDKRSWFRRLLARICW